MPKLLDMPNEILLCITEYLTREADINAFVQLNTRFYAAFNDLLYDRSLDKSGFVVMWAAKDDRLRTMEKAINVGKDLMDMDCIIGALENAAATGQTSILKLLIGKYRSKRDEIGSEVGKCSGHGLCYGYDRCCEYGRCCGYGLCKEDLSSLLYTAARGGHACVIELLLQEGASIKQGHDYFDQSAVVGATEMGHESLILLLLDLGANIEERDMSGRTPLMIASANGMGDIVKILLRNGADVAAVDEDGKDALWWAGTSNQTAIVELCRIYSDTFNGKSSYLEMYVIKMIFLLAPVVPENEQLVSYTELTSILYRTVNNHNPTSSFNVAETLLSEYSCKY